jgi:hypothetical protein
LSFVSRIAVLVALGISAIFRIFVTAFRTAIDSGVLAGPVRQVAPELTTLRAAEIAVVVLDVADRERVAVGFRARPGEPGRRDDAGGQGGDRGDGREPPQAGA